ncbi:hypothetical protein EK0264_14845 [Epidermidibacterium keratini]|uniref:Tetratricopeptide repeat protein n=1 Tax=Epidermidibacterium keratini TaxID=1891644 RepID=A0A7L4YQ90_9ACTN|nr:hypothetical protein [Epidermidibacterium keratini]QHC01441.1 hypothetical protein EK0264_14845 [Epidermidibacterium keratini]
MDEDGVLRKWALAVELGARGRYGQAYTVLEPLLDSDDPHHDALASSVLASHRRQVCDHEAARALDQSAIDRWEQAGLDTDWQYADLVVGRAADAIGMGELDDAREWLAAADAVIGEGGYLRCAVRAGWVRGELAMAQGEPDDAALELEALAPLLDDLRSDRHRCKSRMLLAATYEQSSPEHATELLEKVLSTAKARCWHSLMWPSAYVLGRIAGEGDDRDDYYDAASAIVQTIALDLSPLDASRFVAAVPAELRGED